MPTTRKTKRDQIIQLLSAGDIPAVADLTANTGGVVTILLQMLFEPGSLLHWRATEAIGYIAKIHPKRLKKLFKDCCGR